MLRMETEVKRPEARTIPEDQFRYRLLLARLHAGNLTTREAAERCGVNYVSWSNWERGMKPRDLVDVVERVSEGLGVDRDWLLFGGPLAKEERRPGRVLSRSRRLTGSYPTPGHVANPRPPTSHHPTPTRPRPTSPDPATRRPQPSTRNPRPARLSRPAGPHPTSPRPPMTPA
jgi:transcriptional regulator with XRE-family HTH domain